MAPAHVPAPPAPEVGAGGLRLLPEAGPPSRTLSIPLVQAPRFREGASGNALPALVPSSSSLPRSPLPKPRQWLTPPAYGMR